jgi:hypothetical protein
MAETPRRLPQLTDRLPLGTSGLAVSPFAIGIVMDEDTIPAAYDAGINFFFVTADMHWPLYDYTRRGLVKLLERGPAIRDSIVVGVASYVSQPEFSWLPYKEVLMVLPELGRIDLTIAGGAYGHDFPRRLEILKAHKASAFVGARAIGTSFHDRAAARQALDDGVIDIAFARFNPPYPGAREDLFPHTRPLGDGRHTLLFNFKSTIGHITEEDEYARLGIGSDFWRPHVTDYYRFVLAERALDGILCAPPTPAAIRELGDALAKGPLDDEDVQYLLDLGALQRGKARLNPT